MKLKPALCNSDCNHCPIIGHPNNRLLTKLLIQLQARFGDGVYEIVQNACPNLTVCFDCRIDDFVHVVGCELATADPPPAPCVIPAAPAAHPAPASEAQSAIAPAPTAALAADAAAERTISAMTAWLEKNQPDVFRRGLWDAIQTVKSKVKVTT